MREIPDCVRNALDPSVFLRAKKESAREVLMELGIRDDTLFARFFLDYIGPYGSRKFSHELLDLVDQNENIRDLTQLCRDEYGFPDSYVVLTNMSAMSVLVYDINEDSVYDVDFEGGDDLLRRGVLEAKWRSFEQFIIDYFC